MVNIPREAARGLSADMHVAAVKSAYAVSETPVTFAQWEVCRRDGGCDGYSPDRQGWAANTPVVNVSYEDAQAYLRWLGKRTGITHRLIREDEWVYLALAGRTTVYPWGDLLGAGHANCLDCKSKWDGQRTAPVKAFKANAFGLYGMIGNVAHWTQDPQYAANGPTRRCASKADYATILGASWADPSKYLKAEEWACFPKVLRDDTIGFRVVRDPPVNRCRLVLLPIAGVPLGC